MGGMEGGGGAGREGSEVERQVVSLSFPAGQRAVPQAWR